jgi:hypothetical protein
MPNYADWNVTIHTETRLLEPFVKRLKANISESNGEKNLLETIRPVPYKALEEIRSDRFAPFRELKQHGMNPLGPVCADDPEFQRYMDLARELNFCLNAWYWCVNHWGTKWDVDAEYDYHDNGDGTSTFSAGGMSAWNPPTEAFLYLEREWKKEDPFVLDVTCEGWETGCDFMDMYENGKRTITSPIPLSFQIEYCGFDVGEYLFQIFDENGSAYMIEPTTKAKVVLGNINIDPEDGVTIVAVDGEDTIPIQIHDETGDYYIYDYHLEETEEWNGVHTVLAATA